MQYLSLLCFILGAVLMISSGALMFLTDWDAKKRSATMMPFVVMGVMAFILGAVINALA